MLWLIVVVLYAVMVTVLGGYVAVLWELTDNLLAGMCLVVCGELLVYLVRRCVSVAAVAMSEGGIIKHAMLA